MPRKKKVFRNIIITTGALLLLAGAPIVQENPLGEYLNSMTGVITAQAATQSSRWVGSGDRWQVRSIEGTGFLKNTWFQDDVTGHWYLLGAEDGSVMYSGLVTDQSTGKTYLLNTNHDGTYGRMVTTDGAYTINGLTVYLQFDQNHTGTFGAIISGLSEARSTGVEEKSLANIPTAEPETKKEAQKEQSNMNSDTGYISGSYEDAQNRMAGATFDTSGFGGVARWE